MKLDHDASPQLQAYAGKFRVFLYCVSDDDENDALWPDAYNQLVGFQHGRLKASSTFIEVSIDPSNDLAEQLRRPVELIDEANAVVGRWIREELHLRAALKDWFEHCEPPQRNGVRS